jgi:hypothetical protein
MVRRMTTTLLLAALLGTISVQDQLDGTEIGDATQYIAFQSGGAYTAERTDEKAGTTTAKGSWKVAGDQLSVKIASCNGPACDEMGKGYTAQLAIVAERAMTVKSSTGTRGPLSTGSYYCRFQGCEKRTGVVLHTHGAKPAVMKYLHDFLIDKNRTRDVTVVWWGKKLPEKVAASKLTYCQRDAERAKKGAEVMAKDLSELEWIGKLEPQPSADANCLYDVQLLVADGTELPPSARKK